MIRLAHAEDKARIVELLRDSRVGAEFDNPEGISGFVFPFEPAYAERMFAVYLRDPTKLALVYADGRDEPQGILLAHAYKHDFGPVLLAQERVWWIDPQHRGGSAAARMLDYYENWAARLGCWFAGMAGMGDDPVVAKLYLRRGYKGAETNYLKALVTPK